MKPIWLIESSVFGKTSEPVKEALRSKGLPFEVIQARPFLNGVMPVVNGRSLKMEDCVVFWGTPPLMHHIQLNYRWTPGGWCSFNSFDCTTYYPKLGECLLNHDCRMGPVSSLIPNLDSLFTEFGVNDRVFVRPCSLEKSFTGQLVDRDHFESLVWLARLDDSQILVSRPKKIDTEWRVVMHEGNPISSSRYRVHGDLSIERGCPRIVEDFLSNVWKNIDWLPDPLFVADVCDSNGNLAIIELNSFSCSGWYACDPDPIIDCASQLALDSFLENS